MIILVDALSKEIVDKYDMENVEALMKDGVDTPKGYLGHTGSVTVVTHNVITTGMLPKHMGWTNEGYRDVDGVLGAPSGASTSPATSPARRCSRCRTTRRHPHLSDYLDDTGKVFTVSPKSYAAYAFAGPGSPQTSIITFGSGPTCVQPDGTSQRYRASHRPQHAVLLLGRLRLALAGGARQGLRHAPGPGQPLPRARRPLRRR